MYSLVIDNHISPECPPIAGYTGHIPHMRGTEFSLSHRYNTAVQKGLALLNEERQHRNAMAEATQAVHRALQRNNRYMIPAMWTASVKDWIPFKRSYSHTYKEKMCLLSWLDNLPQRVLLVMTLIWSIIFIVPHTFYRLDNIYSYETTASLKNTYICTYIIHTFTAHTSYIHAYM